MSSKTDTEVIIGGKVFTLSGYESEEYLQKVASYINNKITEYNKNESFKRLTLDMQNVLLRMIISRLRNRSIFWKKRFRRRRRNYII